MMRPWAHLPEWAQRVLSISAIARANERPWQGRKPDDAVPLTDTWIRCAFATGALVAPRNRP
jgi:hypothetical protein